MKHWMGNNKGEQNMVTKLCKSCKYYFNRRNYDNPRCRYNAKTSFRTDVLSGEEFFVISDLKSIEEMRAVGGQCGPEANLYDTNLYATIRFVKYLWRKIKD